MSREVVLTPKAKETLFDVIFFIRLKWGDKSAEKFTLETNRVINTIAQQPYIFKAYGETDVRKGLINKHTSIVYRILQDRIDILFFWDNRQEPIN